MLPGLTCFRIAFTDQAASIGHIGHGEGAEAYRAKHPTVYAAQNLLALVTCVGREYWPPISKESVESAREHEVGGIEVDTAMLR